jgi:hypothetical protein
LDETFRASAVQVLRQPFAKLENAEFGTKLSETDGQGAFAGRWRSSEVNHFRQVAALN